VNQTRPHCVNQMGNTHSKPLEARHGRGTAWARHGNGMLCVNRPLLSASRTPVRSCQVLKAVVVQTLIFVFLQGEAAKYADVSERHTASVFRATQCNIWNSLSTADSRIGPQD